MTHCELSFFLFLSICLLCKVCFTPCDFDELTRMLKIIYIGMIVVPFCFTLYFGYAIRTKPYDNCCMCKKSVPIEKEKKEVTK